MTIYTAEINGRGIAAFDAVDLVAALGWAHGTVFQKDLFCLETDGARRVPTARRGQWTPVQVRAVLRRGS